MTDAALTADLTTSGIRNTAPADASTTRNFRTAGYCEECGTWDAHGLTCVSCGYDFSGAEPDVAGR